MAALEAGRWISNERDGPIIFVPYGDGEAFYRRHYPFTIELGHPSIAQNSRIVQEACIALRDQLGYAAYRKLAPDGGGFDCGRRSLWHRTFMTMWFKEEEHALLTRVMLL